MRKIFYGLILLYTSSWAQTTSIPDVNFEQALIDLGYDVGVPDGKVLTHTIDTITFLHIPEKGIDNLSGIENFVALKYLECYGNRLTNLDVSNNTFLEYLGCGANLLTSIDVSKNTNLSQLYCGDNLLTELDVTNNIHLINLHCWINQLTSLDLTQNINLVGVGCSNNSLTCLNVKNNNNVNMKYLSAVNNPNLSCVEVDDLSYVTANWTGNLFEIDSTSSYNDSCVINCITKVDEHSLSDLLIYPNPTKGDISIDLGETRNNLKVTIRNSIGQKVLSEQYEATNFISLEMNVAAGVYFVQLKSNDRKVEIIKLLKQ